MLNCASVCLATVNGFVDSATVARPGNTSTTRSTIGMSNFGTSKKGSYNIDACKLMSIVSNAFLINVVQQRFDQKYVTQPEMGTACYYIDNLYPPLLFMNERYLVCRGVDLEFTG